MYFCASCLGSKVLPLGQVQLCTDLGSPQGPVLGFPGTKLVELSAARLVSNVWPFWQVQKEGGVRGPQGEFWAAVCTRDRRPACWSGVRLLRMLLRRGGRALMAWLNSCGNWGRPWRTTTRELNTVRENNSTFILGLRQSLWRHTDEHSVNVDIGDN